MMKSGNIRPNPGSRSRSGSVLKSNPWPKAYHSTKYGSKLSVKDILHTVRQTHTDRHTHTDTDRGYHITIATSLAKVIISVKRHATLYTSVSEYTLHRRRIRRKIHVQMKTRNSTLWATKMCHFVFDYNSGVSWSIFILFQLVPVETWRNTLQFTYLMAWWHRTSKKFI